MSITVVQGEEKDLPVVARLFAEAFHDDPVIAAMIPGQRDRLRRLTRMFLAELRTGAMVGGAVDLAYSEQDDRIVGAAAWESPDHKVSSWAKLRELPRAISAVGLRHLPQTIKLLDIFARSRPGEPHWYLVDIAVGENARGLGSRWHRSCSAGCCNAVSRWWSRALTRHGSGRTATSLTSS